MKLGGKNSLLRKELTGILNGIGCRNVRTYIQSGNLVFQSDASAERLSDRIAEEILRERGFKPQVLVLEGSEFKKAVEQNPFPEGASDPRSLHLGFLDAVPENPNLEALEALKTTSERFELIDRVFYLFAPDGIGRSKLAAKSEKSLGVPMTDRNWKTVGKVMAMLEGREG